MDPRTLFHSYPVCSEFAYTTAELQHQGDLHPFRKQTSHDEDA